MQKFLSLGYSLDKGALMPQEEMLAVNKQQKRLIIGIPKEDFDVESRISLTPEAVELLVENDHEVWIESNAGEGANYPDHLYSESGAFITETKKEIFKADIVLKVAPFTQEEIEMFKGNQVAFSSLHLINRNKQHFEQLMRKKVTSVAFEYLKDEHNNFAVERAMSAISGNTAILIAAEYLSNTRNGKGVLLGGITGITPTEVVLLGAGNASESAIRAALGLGAQVKVFDRSLSRLRQLQDRFGIHLYTSVLHPRVVNKALKSADVVIGAIPPEEIRNHFFITEETVKDMKEGSVIVDITLNQGGCIETAKPCPITQPAYTKHGVIHYCVTNLPTRVARTASIALSNIFTPLLLNIGASGGFTKHVKYDPGLRNGIYIYNGILTNSRIGSLFDLPSQNIDLLIAAF